MLRNLFFLSVSVLSFLGVEKAFSSEKTLDEIALEAGTDKSSAFHAYTRVYAPYFEPFRNEPIKFLEIGIFNGDSVKLWENFFTEAELHFIDISDKRIQYFSKRSHYHFLDQSDAKALNHFSQSVGGNFDLIIDDGGHTMVQQMTSFKTLFPYLKSGGLYVIEDLHTAYWKSYGGGGSTKNPKAGRGTTIEMLHELIDDLNYVGAATECADASKAPEEMKARLNLFQAQIESIQFYSSISIIKKK